MEKVSMSLPRIMQGLTNYKRANATQLDWLLKNRCRHRHNYIRHFGCFLKEYDITERVGYLDIETSNLKANFGIVICWCILDKDTGDIYEDYLTKEDVTSGVEDGRVVSSCIDCMSHFDRLVGHYSTYFDIPFLRTRALIHKLKFPEYGELFHTDVWRMAKQKLCLHSNRQDCVAEALQGKTVKTRIDHPSWRKAVMGNAVAIKEVLDHCEKDVYDLKKNHLSLLPYCREVRSSI